LIQKGYSLVSRQNSKRRYFHLTFGTVPCGTVPCGTVPCGTVPCGTVPWGTVLYGTVPWGTVLRRRGLGRELFTDAEFAEDDVKEVFGINLAD
jgi:hypothetical protein